MPSENIEVVCRFRPPTLEEAGMAGFERCIQYTGERKVQLQVVDDKPGEAAQGHSFTYGQVFQPGDEQSTLYQYTAAPMVESLLGGFNSAIIAYGQTGSGKTFTMMGDERQPGNRDTQGIMPRLVGDLFREIRPIQESGVQISVSASYVELYLERVRDLLRPVAAGTTTANGFGRTREGGFSFSGSTVTAEALGISGSTTDGINIHDCTHVPVASTAEVMAILHQGTSARATAATNSNTVSSRSHAILVLTITQRTGRGTKRSQLYCVDLAGSERQKKTGADALRLDEANRINTSLLALGNVINALAENSRLNKKKKHKGKKKLAATEGVFVPYRDSKLTRILQNALGGNSRTVVVCCCSPGPSSARETLSTLRFGDRASSICNRPTAVVQRSVADLERLLKASEELATQWRVRALAAEQTLATRPTQWTVEDEGATSHSAAANGLVTQNDQRDTSLTSSTSDIEVDHRCSGSGLDDCGGGGGKLLVVGSGRRAPMRPQNTRATAGLNISATLCPLSGDVMLDPVLAGDGRSYERADLELFWKRNGTVSPLTGQRLPGGMLVPNHSLRALIASIFPPEDLQLPPDWFSFLPLDAIQLIFMHLVASGPQTQTAPGGDGPVARRLIVEAQTLCRCAQVCRDWRALSMGTAAWIGLLQGVGVDSTAECSAAAAAGRAQRPNEWFHLACVEKLKSCKHQRAASSTGPLTLFVNG